MSTDQAAIETLLAAAGHAIHLGAEVELLTAALARLPPDDSRSVDTATKIVSILGQTGRVVDAEAMVAQRRPTLTPEDDARMSAALAAAYAQQADPAGVLRHCNAIPDKTLLPALERRLLLTNEGFGLFLALRLDDAETVARRAIEEGTRSSDHRTATSGAGLLCFCTLARGHGRDAAAMGLDVAKHWPGYGQFILELALINEDRLADAQTLFESAVQPIAEQGQLTVQLMLQAQTPELRCWRVGSTTPRPEAKPSSRSPNKPTYQPPPRRPEGCSDGWQYTVARLPPPKRRSARTSPQQDWEWTSSSGSRRSSWKPKATQQPPVDPSQQHGTGSSHSATSAPGRASAPTSCGSILPQAIAAMPPM